jgi:hypothetical protein
METTGVRNSWAHAAMHAYLQRALAAGPLGVHLLNGLEITWPREDSSPDGIHYLRQPFRHRGWNMRGLHQRHGFTPPPIGATCIGDAGWEVAMALHRRIVGLVAAGKEPSASSAPCPSSTRPQDYHPAAY